MNLRISITMRSAVVTGAGIRAASLSAEAERCGLAFTDFDMQTRFCFTFHISYYIRYMEGERMASTVKAYKGMGMEGSVAHWYDRTTRKDMPEFKVLAARIAAMVAPAATVLEVAPGPGFLSIELARR